MKMVEKFTNYVDQECPYCHRLLTTTSAYTLHLRKCKQNPESEWCQSHQKVCPKCGKSFVGDRTFCSRHCANGHVESAEQIEKMKSTLHSTLFRQGRLHCNKKEKRFCEGCQKEISWENKFPYCNSCRRKYVPYSEEAKRKQSEKLKGRSRWNIHRNQISYAEKFWINVLNNNEIPFEREYPVKKLDNIHCYFLDFFIERNGKKLDLEIDGKQHEYRKESDRNRDVYLSSKDFIVYRIPWNEINSEKGKLLMKEKIDKFLVFYQKLI